MINSSPTEKKLNFLVISGPSGAGKNTAARVLEGAGFFTVDNLPPKLWFDLFNLCKGQDITNIAVVTDIRTRFLLDSLEEAIQNVGARLVFLEADDEILIQRYNFTRRYHPLGHMDFAKERSMLQNLKEKADVIIDTSHFSPNQLADAIREVISATKILLLRLSSFGFKHGSPRDADLILDVRGLVNPYYIPKLHDLSGKDHEVVDYIFSKPKSQDLYQKMLAFIEANIELAIENGRSGYSIAIGCTGGRHRSVAFVEKIAEDLASAAKISVDHRDIDK